MEVKDYNQYIVKVDGTRRLTLRNRQFLRRYRPHQLFGFSHPPQPCLVASDPSPPVSVLVRPPPSSVVSTADSPSMAFGCHRGTAHGAEEPAPTLGPSVRAKEGGDCVAGS